MQQATFSLNILPAFSNCEEIYVAIRTRYRSPIQFPNFKPISSKFNILHRRKNRTVCAPKIYPFQTYLKCKLFQTLYSYIYRTHKRKKSRKTLLFRRSKLENVYAKIVLYTYKIPLHIYIYNIQTHNIRSRIGIAFGGVKISQP